MTNRKDMIDDALLRPGRLEVQVEISLPDEGGRHQILKIHTTKMREADYLDQTVSLHSLAADTKNFSGAEIEGLVKSAASYAFARQVRACFHRLPSASICFQRFHRLPSACTVDLLPTFPRDTRRPPPSPHRPW